MISCICALVLLTKSQTQSVSWSNFAGVSLAASESVWVYEHAGDPAGDEFLRIWGQGGTAVPTDPNEASEYSFGYLSFDVSKVAGGKLKKAVLVLHNISPAAFGEDDVKSTPLQARELKGEFVGANWSYSDVSGCFPGPDSSVFGLGKLTGPIVENEGPEIDIDLMRGPNDFSAALAKAIARHDHKLFLSLASGIQANSHAGGGGGMGGVYKVYSANAKNVEFRPTLKLEFLSGG